MLIIEGADCVGKTKLAEDLAMRLDKAYKHSSKGFETASDYVTKLDLDNVYDRWHLSEHVYARLLKRKTCMDIKNTIAVARQTRQAGFLTIVLVSDPQFLLENLHKQEGDHIAAGTTKLAASQILVANHLFSLLPTACYNIMVQSEHGEWPNLDDVLEQVWSC